MSTRTPLRDRTNSPSLALTKNSRKSKTPIKNKRDSDGLDSEEGYKTAQEWDFSELLEELEEDVDLKMVGSTIPDRTLTSLSDLKDGKTPTRKSGPQHYSTPTHKDRSAIEELEMSQVLPDWVPNNDTTVIRNTPSKKEAKNTFFEDKEQIFECKDRNEDCSYNSKQESSKYSSANTLDIGFSEDRSERQNTKQNISRQLNTNRSVHFEENKSSEVRHSLNTLDSSVRIKGEILKKESLLDVEVMDCDQTIIFTSNSEKVSADDLLDITSGTVPQTATFVPLSQLTNLEKEIIILKEKISNLLITLNEREENVIQLTSDLDNLKKNYNSQIDAALAEKEEELKTLRDLLTDTQKVLENSQERGLEDSKLINELKSQLSVTIDSKNKAETNLGQVESSFSEIFGKYERSKSIVDRYKEEIETLTVNLKRSSEMLKSQTERHKKLKEEARREINAACESKKQEIKRLQEEREKETIAKDAKYRCLQLKANDLEEELKRSRENMLELTVICDSLITKLGTDNKHTTPEQSGSEIDDLHRE